MFILTPGASFDYEPSARFIDNLPGPIKTKISLVVCLDQLIDSSAGDTDAAPKLYVHDSERSKQSNVRDAFIYSLRQQVSASGSVIAELVEVGASDQAQQGFTPYEHLAYAEKGLAALTLTVRESAPKSRSVKFSLLDTELCLCKLSKLLFLLNEAMA